MSTVFEFEAIGTQWTIDVYKKLSSDEESFLYKKILDRIAIFDAHYSRFRKDSLVTRMSEEVGEYVLPSDAEKMFEVYRRVYDITQGRVTPLIGTTLVQAGYDREYSLKPEILTVPDVWDDVLVYTHPTLHVKKPTLLDFGAGGKGYLVDIVSDLIRQTGEDSFCVDAGGDMFHQRADATRLRVGLENPDNISEVLGVASVGNESICGSAGNRRAWDKYHHILDPFTLSSPREISAVWTKSSSALVADILTTALSFVSPEILTPHFDFQYFIVYADGSYLASSGFEVELFR